MSNGGKHGRDEERDRTWIAVPVLSSASEKRAYLLVLAGPQFGSIFPLEAGRELVLGRRDDTDIPVRDDGVSRMHASIRVEGNAAVLKDLGSANGTYVDGNRVPELRVTDGARIQIGAHTTLKFVWADELEACYQMRLAQGALHDPLTGLYNRRHLDERFAAELGSAQRHGRPVSLLMIDVDRFKEVNDAHGHLAGDEALKGVASVLRAEVRKEDVLARYGGEEFVVIARETALDGAHALAERIRRAVERSRCAWRGLELTVTVSIGVAVSAGIDAYVAGRTERELVEAADRALLRAKQGGRNRVVALSKDQLHMVGERARDRSPD
jgi:diguanylate cyclase (GGDEF)-like protein